MNIKDYNKTKKKVEDFYNHYLFLLEEANKTNLDTTYFKSFISNGIILKITELNNHDYKKYKKILKEAKVYDNLVSDSILRKIKKKIISISPKLYYKLKKK